MAMEWWHTKQWRLIQTNFDESGMLDIDAQGMVAALRDFRANVLEEAQRHGFW